MPTYTRRCLTCDHIFDYFCTISEMEQGIACEKCTAKTEWVPTTSGSGGGHGFPFTSPNVLPWGQGEGGTGAMTFESLADYRKKSKEYGFAISAFEQDGSNQQDRLKDAPVSRPYGCDYEGELAPNLRRKYASRREWE